MADAVRDWLAFDLSGRDTKTVTKCTILANTHIMPLWERVSSVICRPTT